MDLKLTRRSETSGSNPDEGDIHVGVDGQVSTLTGNLEEAQCIGVGLATYQGEWFLDTNAGVPYLTKILGIKGVSATRVQEILTAEILRRGSVTRVRRITLNVDSRRVGAVEFEAETTAGDVSGTVSL